MKLLNENDEIRVLREEIVIDTNLPKYSRFKKERKQGEDKPKDYDPDEEVMQMTETDYISYLLGDSEKEHKIISGVINIPNLREVVGDESAARFNLRITDYLMKKVKINRENRFMMSTVTNTNTTDARGEEYGGNSRLKIIDRFKRYFRSLNFISQPEEIIEFSVLDLFNEIKVQGGKEKELTERIGSYIALIKRAQALGQVAQEEILVSELVVHIYELIASVSGYSKYLDHDDLVKLQKKCKRQLDMDYVKNFVRVIPEDVMEKKLRADQLEIFDNYVVLYYDPTGKSYQDTVKEKERIEAAKRDPVLFGVISGSKKLYYIADWVDELCDLSWADIVEKLDNKIKEV